MENSNNCKPIAFKKNCDNRFGEFFIVLVLFILLALIVSAVYSY